MKVTSLFGSTALSLVSYTTAAPTPEYHHRVSRALPNTSSAYAPVHVTCPENRPTLRSASTLSPEEISWSDTRRGSFRAMLNGAGALKAYDSRTQGANAKGRLGGLLQSTTYISALGGGSWLLGSVVFNNFSSVSALQEDFWNFTSESIIMGPPTMTSAEYWGNITTQVKAKKTAGFITSDADIWGRMEGYYFFNASHGGVNLTWSSLTKTQTLQGGDMPLPLVVVNGISFDKSNDLPTQADPIYEFTPWEFGTYDDSTYGFAPLEYLGTRFVNGVGPENETCVHGNDNAGLVIGTSSDIWNEGGDIAADLHRIIAEIPTNSSEGALLAKEYTTYLQEFFKRCQLNKLNSQWTCSLRP
ncbi:FabD/lysophospholipase-like protein [Aspergillus ellipticus CBS 707.79]|uniref:Lysophospholipase n=1 Tax=Aspergillus ellipticus CBS 707.79 TaxID=1448320 RepID=A0A319D2W8_9EURO|nr:FabD/lysophospholipase-like protein [Aspergillus ellipticus CBS 707.79]